jgi:hypothetical protein
LQPQIATHAGSDATSRLLLQPWVADPRLQRCREAGRVRLAELQSPQKSVKKERIVESVASFIIDPNAA